MRRSALSRAFRGLLRASSKPGSAAVAARGCLCADLCSAAPCDVTSAAAALRIQLCSGRGFSAAVTGGSGTASGGSSEAGSSESGAWGDVSQLSAAATEMAEEGRQEEAKAMLRRELPKLVEQYGAEDPSVGLIFNQLALWSFYDGQYEEAVEAARAAHTVWVGEMGADSPAAAFHGIRLGMALTASGHPEEAFELLEKGLSVAVENYNHHLQQLETLQPLAEDSSAAAEGASEQDEQAMAARAEQQRSTVTMLERLGRALQEAKFYRALSFLGVRGVELNDKWDDNGAGATFFLQQEMSDAVTDMLRWVVPDHPTVQAALREHERLVAQCERQALRRLGDDLQIHGQRLRDLVEEAKNGKDG